MHSVSGGMRIFVYLKRVPPMPSHINLRKYRLMEEIMLLEDEQILGELEQRLRKAHDPKVMFPAIRPIRPAVTLQQLIEEQGYLPIGRDRFFEQVDALDLEEPLEDLLQQLTA